MNIANFPHLLKCKKETPNNCQSHNNCILIVVEMEASHTLSEFKDLGKCWLGLVFYFKGKLCKCLLLVFGYFHDLPRPPHRLMTNKTNKNKNILKRTLALPNFVV